MDFKRKMQANVAARFDYRKAILLLGLRQVGKTTLMKQVAADKGGDYLYLNGDEQMVQTQLSAPTVPFLKALIGTHKVVVIDEAQRIPNIGLTLKLMTENLKKVQLLVTGSSSIELGDTINEPLTGRKWEMKLYPISWQEIVDTKGLSAAMAGLDNLIVLGSYPEVLTQTGQEIDVLTNLATSYLYKDLLSYEGIRKPALLDRILQALALQVGSEVSYNELSRTVGADKATVSNYIDLLEKAFLIYKLPPFNRNLRTEISSSRKIYFADNGIRNAIIGNYAVLPLRQDVGALWENFLISERTKQLNYNGFYGRQYFWRSKAQAEIDYIEEIDGQLHAFEFKWNPATKVKFSRTFTEAYKPATTQVITRENYWEWLSGYPYRSQA